MSINPVDVHDVNGIIIGAGPAGLSAGIHLCQLGDGWEKRIIVLKKASHPREMLCSGGVTRFGLRRAKSIGLDFPLSIGHVKVKNARLVYFEKVLEFRTIPQFLVFDRDEFDFTLLSKD